MGIYSSFRIIGFFCTLTACSVYGFGQLSKGDSIRFRHLPTVLLKTNHLSSELAYLPRISVGMVNVAKKNSVIIMDKLQASTCNNTMRQVLARVPGIQIWESDGSGIQVGIASRGLSPNRSWEFNVRQNGYDISADPYGYPEAYYQPPLQAVKNIVLVRGHGSLQYGPQFGGMVDYVLRNGSDIKSPLQVETQQTAGNNGFFGSYNALGGKSEKGHFYTFMNHINGDGWRQNSRFYANTYSGSITRKLGTKIKITAELTHNQQRMQQPGGLTDSAWQNNPKQSFRSRNWLDIQWTTAAILSTINIGKKSTLDLRAFFLSGKRRSIGFLRPINIADTINKATGAYNYRNIDKDSYSNMGFEARFQTSYRIGQHASDFLGGIRLFNGNTLRLRDGKGSTGNDFESDPIDALWPKSINCHSSNFALFAENNIRLGKLDIIPGIRMEYLDASVNGRNGFAADGTPILLMPEKKNRPVFLGGIGLEYGFSTSCTGFANITRAYRPILFSELTAPAGTELIDSALKDASGFNADLGLRGKMSNWLNYDAGIFLLRYNNRIGTLMRRQPDGSLVQYRTNIGNSNSAGLELLIEANLWEAFGYRPKRTSLSGFISYAWNRAVYQSLRVTSKTGTQFTTSDFGGNRVENAPAHLLRTGLRFQLGGSSFNLQTAFTSETYTDAANTIVAAPNAQNGLLPSYWVTDFNWQHDFRKHWQLKCAINNLGNIRYATRRSAGYPGPGLLPADGRNANITLAKTF